MDRALVVILLILSVVGLSTNASSRVLLTNEVAKEEPKTGSDKIPSSSPSPNNSSTQSNNQSLSPVTNEKSESDNKSEPETLTGSEKNGTQKFSPPVGPEKRDPSPPIEPETKKPTNSSDKGDEIESGNEGSKIEKGSCDSESEKCLSEDKWIACLQHSPNVWKELYLIVENKGDKNISIEIKPTPALILDINKTEIAKDHSQKVSVRRTENTAAEITVTAGKSNCILHIKPTAVTGTPDWQKPFQQFAGYATLLTPIYGAYFLLFTFLVFLVTWACCKFTRGRRTRSEGGARYQQLEMGQNRASSADADVAADTADGWENGWDDDWDDEEAVTGKNVKENDVSVNNINGISSIMNGNSNNNNINSSSTKDGWDVDWDD